MECLFCTILCLIKKLPLPPHSDVSVRGMLIVFFVKVANIGWWRSFTSLRRLISSVGVAKERFGVRRERE
jgi:hypothetical protein